MTRRCPVCHVLLRSFLVREELRLEFCARCAGIWFDKDELNALQEQPIPAGLKLKSDRYKYKIVCAFCGQVNARTAQSCIQCAKTLEYACPACRKELENIRIEGVSVDRCPGCFGVWMDGEEMQKLFLQYQKQAERRERSGSGVTDATATALELLIWNPDLFVLGGRAAGQVLSQLPGAGAAILQHAADLPEVAGSLAEGAVHAASHAAEASTVLVEGALDAASQVPEIAASFVELIASLIAGLFD